MGGYPPPRNIYKEVQTYEKAIYRPTGGSAGDEYGVFIAGGSETGHTGRTVEFQTRGSSRVEAGGECQQ